MSLYKIFVVEDDSFTEVCWFTIYKKNPDYDVFCFQNASSCLKKLHLKPDIITIDYKLPDTNGSELYHQIKKTPTHTSNCN